MGCFWLTTRANCDSVRSACRRGPAPVAPAAPSIVERGGQVLQVAAKILAQRRMRQRQFDRRLQVAELAAAVEAPAGETMRIHRLMLEQARDTVGQLDLPAGALADVFELIEDPRRQHVAADHRQRRWGHCGLGLLDDAADAAHGAVAGLDLDDAVFIGIALRYLLDPEHAAAALGEGR